MKLAVVMMSFSDGRDDHCPRSADRPDWKLKNNKKTSTLKASRGT